MAGTDGAARARAFWTAAHTAVCDVVTPWAHGTIVRATRYPTYHDYNLIRVEDDAPLTADELVEIADEALAGLAHRRIDFDVIASAERVRDEFQARGWKTVRLLWMRHDGTAQDEDDRSLEEVPYDAVADLRDAWHREDFPQERDPRAYHEAAREVALARGARVVAAVADGVPVAFAQLERDGDAAEVSQVFVRADRRGAGLGTAITKAAIRLGSDARDLFIVADDEDRPKELYARLGFRPVWTTMELTLWPER
jgi:GNAT superfamily N-acetyltransferase